MNFQTHSWHIYCGNNIRVDYALVMYNSLFWLLRDLNAFSLNRKNALPPCAIKECRTNFQYDSRLTIDERQRHGGYRTNLADWSPLRRNGCSFGVVPIGVLAIKF